MFEVFSRLGKLTKWGVQGWCLWQCVMTVMHWSCRIIDHLFVPVILFILVEVLTRSLVWVIKGRSEKNPVFEICSRLGKFAKWSFQGGCFFIFLGSLIYYPDTARLVYLSFLIVISECLSRGLVWVISGYAEKNLNIRLVNEKRKCMQDYYKFKDVKIRIMKIMRI